MEQHYYNDFSYLIKPSPISGKRCVEVSFRCNNKTVKHYVFIKEEPGVDYFKEAKKIIDSEIASGKLYKISKRYHAPNPKPLLITLTTIFFATACSLGGLAVYKYMHNGGGVVPPPPPGPTPVTDTVELVVSNPQSGYSVDLTNKSSTTGSEYRTDITLNHPIQVEYVLPNTLDQVTVNDSQITSGYTYTLGSDKLSANFLIPANLVTGKIKITLTLVSTLPPEHKKIKLESSDLWLCDQNNKHLPNNEIEFDTSVGCTVRIEKPTQSNDNLHVPLDINVMANDKKLSFGANYQYYFIDDEIAEFKVSSIADDITISAEATDAIAQFLYIAPAHSEKNITLSYETENSSVYTPSIDWGDNTDEPVASVSMEVGKIYKSTHPFKNDKNEDEECFISVKPVSGYDAPEFIGFDTRNNIRDDCYYFANCVDIAAPIANYASGINNIKAARLTTDIDSLVDDGLSHTDINSLFIPSSMPMYYYFDPESEDSQPFPSNYFAFCSNIDSVYVGSNNSLMVTNDRHDMLLQRYEVGEDALGLFLVANNRTSEGVIIDKYENIPIVEIAPFAFAGRTAKNITIGPSVESAADGALAFCEGLETINVDVANPNFIQNEAPNKPINMLVWYDDDFFNADVITTTSKTDFTKLPEVEDGVNFRPYSISGSNTPSEILLPDKFYATLNEYSIYHTDNLETLTFNGYVYWNIYSADYGPMIYDCKNLKSVTFGYITNSGCPDSAVIQKCPDVESLSILDSSDKGGAFTYQNAIYYSDEDSPLTLVGVCKNSNLSDSAAQVEGYYIEEFTPYVFNGNNFGTGSIEGGTKGEIYISKDTTDINPLAFAGISSNADISFKIDKDNPYYEVHGDDSLLFSKVSKSLLVATLSKGANELVINRTTESVTIVFESNCMVDDVNLRSIKIIGNSELVPSTFESVEFKENAFYNCPNLKTIDLSGLADSYVPDVSETSFIQSECSPYDLNSITVIVNPKSEEAFRDHSIWGQFNIIPANI